jgi:hypothetical protein
MQATYCGYVTEFVAGPNPAPLSVVQISGGWIGVSRGERYLNSPLYGGGS